MKALIELQKKRVARTEALNMQNEITNEQLKEASGYVTGIFDSFKSGVSMLPGGSMMASIILPDAQLDAFKDKTSEIFNKMQTGVMTQKDGFKALADEGIGLATGAMEAFSGIFSGNAAAVGIAS